VRCLSCGRRLTAQKSSCPIHGAVPVAQGAAEASAPVEEVWPSIPGFQIEGVLGRGGFGTVYAARRQTDGVKAAIKVARREQPSAGVKLSREADALRAVGPPCVPQVYANGEVEGSAYAALEFVGAPTLAEMLSGPDVPMSPPVFLENAEGILAAVEAVHAREMIHCDLKPENIFIEALPRRAVLVDFGLVHLASDRAGTSAGAPDGTIQGTAEYMSPEQCGTGSALDLRSDIYSLGIIFYEMLTGAVPFFGTVADVQEAQRSKRPPRLSSTAQVPAALEEVVLRCLAKQPEQRFPSIAALRDALRAAAAAKSDAAPAKPAKAAAPSATAAAREKRSVGMVFFSSSEGTASVQTVLTSFGGQLAHAAGSSYVGVFGHETGDNPAKRALSAARAITGRQIAERALVDLAPVTVQARPGGARRYLSPLFARTDRYPQGSDPAGVLLTDACAKLLNDVPTAPVSGREGIVRALADDAPQELATIVAQQAPPLVGREETLNALIENARAASTAGSPTIATVIADAGHGKSHLCAALIDRLKTIPGTQLLQFRAREPVGGDADQTLRELLSKLLRLPAGERPADGGHALLADRLGPELGKEVWAGVALALGWVTPDAPELRGLSAAPGVLRAAAARAVAAALRQWAQPKPLLFVLDDAQFADEATLDALELAALTEARAPLWICVLARPAFQSGRPNWAERCAQRHDVRLGPLQGDGASELCRTLLRPAENVPAEAIEKLVARTQGVPLLLVELVRALKNEGLVRQNARTGTWSLATEELDRLPDLPLVEWLATRELESLPPDLAAHARLAAILGSEFTADDISGVLQELDRQGAAHSFPLDPAVGTRRLLAGGVLIPRRHGQLSFRHALVRDAVYKSVPDTMRRPIHDAAVHFYSERCPLPEAERLPRLAFHAARSGQRELALGAYATLAERAQARHAYLEAELMYTQALEQMGQNGDPKRVTACRGRGLMRYRLCRYEEACKDFGVARDLAHALEDSETEIEVLLDEATALDWADEYRRSKDLVDKAQQLSDRARTPLIEARLLMGLGRSSFRFSQDVEASQLLDQAARCAEPLGDPGYETYVISLLLNGYVLATLGKLAESEDAFERVIPLCTERGDKLHAAGAMLNRLMLWTCRNEKERLLADLHRVLEMAREMGNGRLEQQVHYYLGLYLRWLHDFEEAAKHARRAVEIDERRLGEAARPESALLLGRVLAASGDANGARGILDEIRARQARARAKGDREIELLPSEEAFFSMVDLATRDADDSEWKQLQERAASCLTGQDLLELLEMRGRAAQRQRRPQAVREAFEEAMALAEKVPNVMKERIKRELECARTNGV